MVAHGGDSRPERGSVPATVGSVGVGTLDLALGLLLVSAAVGGYRLGLVARLGSWCGLVAGLLLGLRFGPPLAESLTDTSGTALRLMATVASVLVPALALQAVGEAVGFGLRRQIPVGAGRTADRIGGGVAGGLSVLVVLWLFLPVLGELSGFAALVRESAVVAFVDETFPEPPPRFRDLRTFVAKSPFPQVFDGMGRAPEASAPPELLPLTAAQVQRISASTVNVEAVGCGRRQEGSGFVVAGDLIATNAHVVAGTDDIEVLFPDGRRVASRLVAYDDDRDVAVLAGAFGASPLELATVGRDVPVAVFGHPDGQDELRVAPGIVVDEITATGRDIYGDDRVRRQVLVLGADLRQGDSGSAIVDGNGRVVGQAFATAPDRSRTAYALTTAEVEAVVNSVTGESVSSGPCQSR